MASLAFLILSQLAAADQVSPVPNPPVLFDQTNLTVTDHTLHNTFAIRLASQPDVASVDIFLGSDHSSLIFDACHKTFTSDNWDQWQNITVTGVPVFNSAKDAMMNIIARDFHGTLNTDVFLPVTRVIAPAQTFSSVGDPHYTQFDGYEFTQMGNGYYYLIDSPQLTIQSYQQPYGAGATATVNQAIAVRYGMSVVVYDVTQWKAAADAVPQFKTVKDKDNMSGMVFQNPTAANPNAVISLPDGSTITITPNFGTVAYINLAVALSAGYPDTTGGMANRWNSNSLLWKRDGTSVDRSQAEDFAASWVVPEKESLFTGNIPAGTVQPDLCHTPLVCKVPDSYTPPPPPTPAPAPAPYVPSPPAPHTDVIVAPITAPPEEFVKQATDTCNKMFDNLFCHNVDAAPFKAICIADSTTTGSIAIAETTKQAYLSKCNMMCHYETYDANPAVVQQATQTQQQLGLSTNECTNKCSNNGQCTSNGCFCNSGFTGGDCSQNLAPLISYNPTTHNYSSNNPIVVIPMPAYPQQPQIVVAPNALSTPCTPGSTPPPAYVNPAPPTSQSAPVAQPPAAAPYAPTSQSAPVAQPAPAQTAAVQPAAAAPTSGSAPVAPSSTADAVATDASYMPTSAPIYSSAERSGFVAVFASLALLLF